MFLCKSYLKTLGSRRSRGSIYLSFSPSIPLAFSSRVPQSNAHKDAGYITQKIHSIPSERRYDIAGNRETGAFIAPNHF